MEINRIVQGGTITVQQESATRVSDLTEANNLQKQSPDQNEDPILSNDFAKKVVEGLNTVLTASNSHLKFIYHEKLQKYYITIVDNRTEEVIKEIPPKKILDMVANMIEQIGLIVDKKI